ncbi:hypothetical protein VTN31DRAFT_1151 [Thermomyces dupontii]|uniref:uncharacterized protein n=1 Tax=Talaromyces thermophilus TaxID=28565 RepID=UPI003744A9CC
MALLLAGTIFWALSWLLYRAWQVLQTPNEVLVDKLGLDIPPAPEVTLEEISAREIRIAWKQPEYYYSVHKHIVQVNGAKVGETKRTETAVTIGDLIPGHIYHICVFAVSAANFQTASAVLHVRTKPLPLSQTQQDASVEGPTIQAYVPRPPAAALAPPSAPMMAREPSAGPPQHKRSGPGRKSSPAAAAPDPSHSQSDEQQRTASREDTGETLEQLAERLKSLQQEHENVDRQIQEEEEEHMATLKELEKQRDELKQRVKEKDEASGDLKKHVNKLESVNRTVQSEKTKRERLLQQKEAERRKRREDIARWKEAVAQMSKDIGRVREEKARVEEEAAKQASELRSKISAEQAEMKGIDEEIQEKGGRIKKLEDERQRLQGGDSEEGKELDRIDTEKARQWEARLSSLHAQYAALVNLHTQAQQQYQEAQERLQWLNSQRTNGTGPFAALQPIELDLSSQAPMMRRPRHRGSLTNSVPPPMAFQMDSSFSHTTNYNGTSGHSPTFAPGSTFFNINNGMTFSETPGPSELFPSESDASFPMSPRADTLLPSDLLGDEDPTDIPAPAVDTQVTSPGPTTATVDNPRSPSVSSETKSASFFTSPRGSLHEVDLPPTTQEEAPREGSSGVQSASRRLSGLFGFNRQRGKTMVDMPPLLGSLKSGQSRSFPRNFDDLEAANVRRRRLAQAANWANPMSFFPRSGAGQITADSSSDHILSKKSAFANIFSSSMFTSGSSGDDAKSSSSDGNKGYNQFSPRHDPIDPSSILGAVRRESSPRPSSTFSFDNQLPHLSTDPFGWSSKDGPGHRGSLGLDWNQPWSLAPSRRPSTPYGSSTHLPLGMASAEPDFLQEPYEKQQRPVQAPIGTRPASSHQLGTKLNPAAPSFKTLFGKKSDKAKDKESKDSKESSGGPKSVDLESNPDDSSPPLSRRSNNSRSLSVATESGDSLDLIPSNSLSDNSGTKESFIQKLTRKGSSSKFNLSWKDRGGIFAKKNESFSGDIDEDANDGEPALGKSFDSTTSTAPPADKSNARSSRNFFGLKSKKDKAGEGVEKASETGDESQ